MDSKLPDRVSQRRAGVAATAALLVLVLCSGASADQVTSKGTTLRGKVTGLTSKSLTLAPEYGEGTIEIKWEDVEDVSTEGDVQVLYGDEEEIVGPVRNKRGTALVVGESEIEVATIHTAVSVGPEGPTWRDRMRSSWRYWDGNFDLGFNLQQSTTDTTGLALAFHTTRIKGPTRLILDAGYRYSTEKKEGTPKNTIQDELRGAMRGEYDILERLYAFGVVDGEYDSIEKLSLRTVPKAGLGYVIYLEELDAKRQNFLKAEAGGGWVYQKYFGGEDNDYFTVAFGALANYYLPYDTKLDWTFDYLPAVDDWANNYLIRTAANLTVPMFDPIAAKFGVRDEYNNKPAPTAAHNSLYVTAGLSIAW